MRGILPAIFFIFCTCPALCQNNSTKEGSGTDESFKRFETTFLDNYWKQYPSNSIFIGYGKYYENLVIPTRTTFASDITFSKLWLDSLKNVGFSKLSDNNKISYKIIKNQLESDVWYRSVFKQYEWDASAYNLS